VIAALPVLKSMSTCDIAPRTVTSLGTSYPRGAAGAGNHLAKVIVQLNNQTKCKMPKMIWWGCKSPVDETAHWRSFPGANNRRAVLRVFVEIEVPDATRLLRVEGLVHEPLKMIGMSIERDNRRCLVAKTAAYRLGDRVAVQVKSVDYYRPN